MRPHASMQVTSRVLAILSGQRSFSFSFVNAICSGYADYPEKEQSNDSNGTDVLSDSSSCDSRGPRAYR